MFNKKNAIPKEPVIEKLRNLRKYLPGAEEIVVEFTKYFADDLERKRSDDLYPFGFAYRYDYDTKSLYHGRHGGGGLIKHKLAKLPWENYALILSYFSKVADAVCPPEFAAKTKRIFKRPRTTKTW